VAIQAALATKPSATSSA
jgi:hypothetical protein